MSHTTAKVSFTFYRRYSFTPDKFRNVAMWLSSPTGGIDIYIRLKLIHICNVVFLSSKCKLSFFAQFILRYDSKLSPTCLSSNLDSRGRTEI